MSPPASTPAGPKEAVKPRGSRGRRPGLLLEQSEGPEGPVLVLRQSTWALIKLGFYVLLGQGGLCACAVLLVWLPTRSLSLPRILGLGLFGLGALLAMLRTARSRRSRRLEWRAEAGMLRLDGEDIPADELAGAGLVHGQGLFAAPYRLLLLRRAQAPLLLAVDVSFRTAERAGAAIRFWLGQRPREETRQENARFEHAELQAASDLVSLTASPEGIEITYRRRAQLFLPHLVALLWIAGFGFQDMRDGDVPWTAGLLFASTLWSLWALMQSRRAHIDPQGVLQTETRPVLGAIKRETFEQPNLRVEINSQGRLCLMAEDRLKRKFLLFDAADPMGIERFRALLARIPALHLDEAVLPQRPCWDGGRLVLLDGVLRVDYERDGLRTRSRLAALYQRPVLPLLAWVVFLFGLGGLEVQGRPSIAFASQILMACGGVLLAFHVLRSLLAWRTPLELRVQEGLRLRRGAQQRTVPLEAASRVALRPLWAWPLSGLVPAWQLTLELAGRPEQLAVAERAETLEPARAWLEALLRAGEDWDATEAPLSAEDPQPMAEDPPAPPEAG